MVLFDVFLAALFYLWQVKGIHGAKTFLECWLWFAVAMHSAFVLFAKDEDKIPASAICRLYDFLSTMVISAALLYFGFVALPISLFIVWVLFWAKNLPKGKYA
jgi:hypothetical protein